MSEKKANDVYKKILKNEIEPILGNKTTFSDQLENVSKKYFGSKFKGVYPSDKIPKLNDLSSMCILNLDKSNESGSHWVALVKYDDKSILYDSFGRNNTKIIPNLIYSGNGRIIDTDKDSEQSILETNCGSRCVAWLVFLDRWGYKNALLI